MSDNGDKVESFTNKFRIKILEANATTYIYSQEYREALTVLSELKKLQSNESDVTKVHTMVMESLCHLRLCQDSAASEVNQNIVKIMTSAKILPDGIIEIAKYFSKKCEYERAYILFYVACKIFLVKEANLAAIRIKSVINLMKEMVGEMKNKFQDRDVVVRHIVPTMKKIVEELVAMPDNDTNDNIEQQAWCYNYIARCYDILGDTEQELQMLRTSINIMYTKFGYDAEKYCITGYCYFSAGNAYDTCRQKIDAFNSAIKVFEKATDIISERRKNEEIANCCTCINNLVSSPQASNRMIQPPQALPWYSPNLSR